MAKAPPERLSKHQDEVHDDRKTGVFKRRVNASAEPNARKRRDRTRTGKLIGKPPLTGINERTGKGAQPKRDIEQRNPLNLGLKRKNHRKGACPFVVVFGGGYLAPCITSSRVTLTACCVGTQSTLRNSAATVMGI